MTTPLYLKPGVIRKTLGRNWSPAIPFGPEGFRFDLMTLDSRPASRVIVTVGPAPDNSGSQEWLHASISHADHMPTYKDLTMLHRAVWGTDGWAYQCFAPTGDHVNISQFALHLWGLPDGRAALPNFGAAGTI